MHPVYEAKVYAVPWKNIFRTWDVRQDTQGLMRTAERWKLRVPTGQGVSRDLGDDVSGFASLEDD
jgi:hypothetical protein